MRVEGFKFKGQKKRRATSETDNPNNPNNPKNPNNPNNPNKVTSETGMDRTILLLHYGSIRTKRIEW